MKNSELYNLQHRQHLFIARDYARYLDYHSIKLGKSCYFDKQTSPAGYGKINVFLIESSSRSIEIWTNMVEAFPAFGKRPAKKGHKLTNIFK